MELIERYVNEVGRRLPKKQRDEVRSELRSALLDAIEESAAAEPTQAAEPTEPTEAQMIDALRRLGPPEAVAASYRPADQYLIGPELFPDFKRVLSTVGTVLLALLVGAFVVGLIARPAASADMGSRLLGLIGGFFDAAWVVFAVVVAIFAGLQRLEVRPQRQRRDWDPRRLPAVRDADLVGKGEKAFAVVAAGVFLSLLYLFSDAIGVRVEPGGQVLLNDIFMRHLSWIAAALLLGMALDAYLFWRGRWEWPTRIANLAIDAFGLVVLYRIAAAVAARESILESSLPAPLPAIVIQTAWSIFAVVLGFAALGAGKTILRAVRRPRAA